MKREQTIKLNDALSLMAQVDNQGKGIPFSVAYVKYNRTKQEGGELVFLDNCCLSGSNRNLIEHMQVNFKQLEEDIPDAERYKAAYIWSILQFNGMRVV